MTTLLEIDQVVKEYTRGVRANDGISFTVRPGEVFGLLGHNGAGKTTLLNQVVGLVRPTSGGIRLDGHDVVADPPFARERCSMQPQGQAPLNGVTPREAIELVGRIRGLSRGDARRRRDHYLDALAIGEWADQKGEKLSGGVQRLTAFAMAAAAPSRLLMLDEPTNDVDPVRRRMLWDQVRSVADTGTAVLLVTHNVHEAEGAVDRLAILDHGRVVAHGTPASLRGADDGSLEDVYVRITGGAADDASTTTEGGDDASLVA